MKKKQISIFILNKIAIIVAPISFLALLITLASGLVMIINPLLSAVLVTFLVLIFPGWLIISMIEPGTHWAEKVGTASMLSVGLWSIPGLLLILLHSNMNAMLIVIVLVTTLLTGLFVLGSFRGKSEQTLPHKKTKGSPIYGRLISWLLVSFGLVLAVCYLFYLFGSTVNIGHVDRWVPEAFIRHIIETDHFYNRGFYIGPDLLPEARNVENIWMLLMAVLVKLTHHDLFTIYTFYLPVPLIIVALFSVYALVHSFFKDNKIACLAVILEILFLSSGVFPSPEIGYGLKWLFRIQEDKYALWFIFLPGITIVFNHFFNSGKKLWYLMLGISLFGISLVHPLGIIFFLIIFFGYSIFELAVVAYPVFKGTKLPMAFKQLINNFIFRRFLLVCFLAVMALVIPIVQQQQQIATFTEIGRFSRYFEVTADMPGIFILALNNGKYAVDKAVLNNVYIIASILAIPCLVLHGFKDRVARLLAGNMILPLLLLFTPLAPIVGNFVTIILLYRVLWVLPVVPALIYVGVDIGKRIKPLQNHDALSIVLFGVLTISAFLLNNQFNEASKVLWQMNNRANHYPAAILKDEYEVLNFLRTWVKPGTTIFAEGKLNENIPGFVGQAYGVHFFNQPTKEPNTVDNVNSFYTADYVTQFHITQLEFYAASSFVVSTQSLLYLQFISMQPGFKLIYSNGSFSVFEIQPDWLQDETIRNIIEGNQAYKDLNYDKATSSYQAVLTSNPYNFWANVILGQLAEKDSQLDEAKIYFTNALKNHADLNLMISLCKVDLRSGQLVEASQLYEKISKQSNNSASNAIRIDRLGGDLFQAKGDLDIALSYYSKASAIERCGQQPDDMISKRYLPQGWPALFVPAVTDFSIWVDSCIAEAAHDQSGNLQTRMYVKYDLVRNYSDGLIFDFPPEPINTGVLSIDGEARKVLFQHPPSKIGFQLFIGGPTRFRFSPVISPEAWKIGYGDGVRFMVWVVEENVSTIVYDRYIDPKNVINERSWIDTGISLNRWMGKTVTLQLETNPGPNGDARYDWAGWGEPQITTPIQYDFYTHFTTPEGEDSSTMLQDTLTINGQSRKIIFQHPLSRITYTVALSQNPVLEFGVGMDPAVWSTEKGDGVEYNIYIDDLETPGKWYRVFSTYIDPKNREKDRRWFDFDVNLHQFAGKMVNVIFETRSGPNDNNSFDWGGWSEPVIIDLSWIN